MVFKFDFISCLFNIGDDEYVKDGDGEAQSHLNWNLILLLDVIKNFRKLPCCANNFSKIWIFFLWLFKDCLQKVHSQKRCQQLAIRSPRSITLLWMTGTSFYKTTQIFHHGKANKWLFFPNHNILNSAGINIVKQ